jgi:hypothetical protein
MHRARASIAGAVMTMDEAYPHPACWTDEQLLRSCEIRFVRRSGPGGQHRNKVSSGVQLVFGSAELVAEANERRNQSENRRVALVRLRRLLAVNVRAAWDAERPLPELWQSRVQGGRIVVNSEHGDVPGLLAIALDCLAAHDWDTGRAAEALGCTTTQLVRFLGEEPAALAKLNAERDARGLKALRR